MLLDAMSRAQVTIPKAAEAQTTFILLKELVEKPQLSRLRL